MKKVDTTRFSFCQICISQKVDISWIISEIKNIQLDCCTFYCGEMGSQYTTSDAIIFFKPCHQGRIFFFFEWVKKARVADKVFCLLSFFYFTHTHTHTKIYFVAFLFFLLKFHLIKPTTEHFCFLNCSPCTKIGSQLSRELQSMKHSLYRYMKPIMINL